MERVITKSFKRLLDKGIHRGFITHEELRKALGKRHFSQDNVEKAFMHIFDNRICLVKQKSDYIDLLVDAISDWREQNVVRKNIATVGSS